MSIAIIRRNAADELRHLEVFPFDRAVQRAVDAEESTLGDIARQILREYLLLEDLDPEQDDADRTIEVMVEVRHRSRFVSACAIPEDVR